MLKKILSISLGMCILLQTAFFAATAAAEDDGEAFLLAVGMLSEKKLKATPQHFTKLDISSYMNRDIKDDVEGDRQGGWSDQGENDLRIFDKFGAQEMLGVPFDFVDPAKNGNKGVLGLRGQNDTGLPTEVTIPINRKAAGAYIIHASPFASETCGRYTWIYSDGTKDRKSVV